MGKGKEIFGFWGRYIGEAFIGLVVGIPLFILFDSFGISWFFSVLLTLILLFIIRKIIMKMYPKLDWKQLK